ncbi:MAG: zf-HC2 domain-containing protein [Kiritimatiellae bacterium]|nr:zf-HC2 domain-containing protein [Kiritimatiellia bacterium]
MKCQACRRLLSEHMDARLGEEKKKELLEHLAGCAACRSEYEQLEQAVALVQGLEEVAPPADLLEHVHHRLRKEERRRQTAWFVFNKPQARIALAAALLIAVCTYSVREFLVPARRHAQSPAYEAPLQDVPEPKAAKPGRELLAQQVARLSGKQERVEQKESPNELAAAPAEAAPPPAPPVVEGERGPAPEGAELGGAIWRQPAAEAEPRLAAQGTRPGLTASEPAEAARADEAPAPAGPAAGRDAGHGAAPRRQAGEQTAPKPDALADRFDAEAQLAEKPVPKAEMAFAAPTEGGAAAEPAPALQKERDAAAAASRASAPVPANIVTITIRTEKRDAVLKTLDEFATKEEPVAASAGGAGREAPGAAADEEAAGELVVRRVRRGHLPGLVVNLERLGKILEIQEPPAPEPAPAASPTAGRTARAKQVPDDLVSVRVRIVAP